MFIAIEGIDGSGKSTLAKHLFRSLSARGYRIHLTREPTEKFHITHEESSSHDVDTALDLFFRFTSDRFSHQRAIKEHLKDGEIVITDRYIASSLAYQGALLEPLFGSPDKTVKWMLQVSDVIDLRPDFTVYLDVEPSISIERIRGRASISGFESVNYLSRVKEYYNLVLGEDTIRLDSTDTPDKTAENGLKEIIRRI